MACQGHGMMLPCFEVIMKPGKSHWPNKMVTTTKKKDETTNGIRTPWLLKVRRKQRKATTVGYTRDYDAFVNTPDTTISVHTFLSSCPYTPTCKKVFIVLKETQYRAISLPGRVGLMSISLSRITPACASAFTSLVHISERVATTQQYHQLYLILLTLFTSSQTLSICHHKA